MTNVQGLIDFFEEQIDNIHSLGEPNPAPINLAHIATDQPEETDEFRCNYEEAYIIASAVIMQQAGIKLQSVYNKETIAYQIGNNLINIAKGIMEDYK